MSYDEEQQRRSRVVVETPTARREVVHQQTTRYPEKTGYSTGVVAAVALAAIAITAIVFLFLTNSGDEPTNTDISVNARPTPMPQPTIFVQQPLTQPTPLVIETLPPTTTQSAPVIVTPPIDTTTTTAPSSTAAAPSNTTDDATIQSRVSRSIQDDPQLSATDIIATFADGRATLTGTVASTDLKRRAERLALTIKGVRRVDNQINVAGGTDPGAANANNTP